MLITNLLILHEDFMGLRIRGFGQIISFLILKHFSRLILHKATFSLLQQEYFSCQLKLRENVITDLIFLENDPAVNH